MTTRMIRRFSGVQLVVVGLLLALMLPATLGAGEARAQDANQLIGIQGSARAYGALAHYNLGAVLPISSPINTASPDSYATISSGPATFARASVLNPGDLLANPDAVLANLDPEWESGTLPPYPYLISAQSGFGDPSAESNPGPGLQARVDTSDTTSQATASVGRSDTPSILNVGGVTTTSTTSTDGSTVTVTAKTEVADINILGLIAIESVTTETSATSDGNDVQLSGETSVGKATILGQSLTIGGEGVAVGPPKSLLDSVLNLVAKQVSRLLTETGITITAGGIVEADGSTTGSIAATGLRIELDLVGRDAPVLGDLLALVRTLDLPPIDGLPIQLADILEVMRGHQVVEIEIAGSGVSLAATSAPPPPEFEVPPTTPPAPPATSGSPPPPASDGPVTTPAPTAPPTSEVAAPAPRPISQISVNSLGTGVGAALVLALLAQPLLGLLIRRWTQGILAPVAAAGDPCSMEVPDA